MKKCVLSLVFAALLIVGCGNPNPEPHTYRLVINGQERQVEFWQCEASSKGGFLTVMCYKDPSSWGADAIFIATEFSEIK
jgi:uncharacterized lipoprotein YmbA